MKTFCSCMLMLLCGALWSLSHAQPKAAKATYNGLYLRLSQSPVHMQAGEATLFLYPEALTEAQFFTQVALERIRHAYELSLGILAGKTGSYHFEMGANASFSQVKKYAFKVGLGHTIARLGAVQLRPVLSFDFGAAHIPLDPMQLHTSLDIDHIYFQEAAVNVRANYEHILTKVRLDVLIPLSSSLQLQFFTGYQLPLVSNQRVAFKGIGQEDTGKKAMMMQQDGRIDFRLNGEPQPQRTPFGLKGIYIGVGIQWISLVHP